MNGDGRARWVIAGPLLGLAFFAVVTAWPSTIDSLIAQQALDPITVLRQKEPVAASDLRYVLDHIAEAPPVARGDRLAAQSVLALALADQIDAGDPERVRRLEQARMSAELQLRRAPSDTHAWARLAYGEYQLNGPSDLTMMALERSHETGPREYYALWPRLRLGALLWAHLSADLRAATMDQAVALMETGDGPWRLARFYMDLPADVQAAFDHRIDGLGADAFEVELDRERARRGLGQ